ncbi:beta-flanking protein [Beauveria brongniartii RCEF 3172]|uniref:Beta-flanking protein n=1 Tax=Beauveria brongniartii RCEF 3172 TaxID=1081107 RepID=A0A167CGA0_9HYPO|nr:beta-flanking protein [Beauveria brongniartii RCEF 3172]
MDSFINAGKDFLAKNSQNSNNNNGNSNNSGGNSGSNNNQSGGSGGNDLFSSVLSSLTHKEDDLKQGDVDEKDAADKHDQVYNKGDNNTSVNAMGTAAAMQALKKFTSGGQEEKGSKNDFISLAMGEASKLFDSKAADGSVASGAEKQSVIQKAAEVAMKLYFKSQLQQSGGSGGLGGLASMASQFIK